MTLLDRQADTVLPWLLEGFGTQVKAGTLSRTPARVAALTCDTAFAQGSDYYFEVQCSNEDEGAAKVCHNTKYLKGKKAAAAEDRSA